MINHEHRRPLCAFGLVSLVAAMVVGNGLRAQAVDALVAAGAPQPVIGAIAPDVVLGEHLDVPIAIPPLAADPAPKPAPKPSVVPQPSKSEPGAVETTDVVGGVPVRTGAAEPVPLKAATPRPAKAKPSRARSARAKSARATSSRPGAATRSARATPPRISVRTTLRVAGDAGPVAHRVGGHQAHPPAKSQLRGGQAWGQHQAGNNRKHAKGHARSGKSHVKSGKGHARGHSKHHGKVRGKSGR